MMRRYWLLAVFAWAVVTCNSARAQDGKAPWEEFENRIKASQSVGALGDDLFGDTISLANGGLSFAATDVEIPGNTGLRVALGRRYTVYNHWKYTNTGSPLADWDLDVPNISGVFAPNWTVGDPYLNSASGARCSVRKLPTQPLRDYYAQDFWHGNVLSIPGVGGGELLTPHGNAMPSSGGPYVWITADNVRISCLSSIKNGTGEGFLAITPDGTRYWFDWMAQYSEPMLAMVGRKSPSGFPDANPVQRRKNVLYATKVQDRFGNTVNYTYTNAWNAPGVLTKIAASDGRQITLTYQSGRVRTVSAGGRAWTYTYGATPEGRHTLTQVTLPDASKWQIGFSQLTDAYIEYRVGSTLEPARGCLYTDSPLNQADQPVGTITHPSGAIGTFRIGIRTHGRSNVPVACYNVITSPSGSPPGTGNDPNDDMNQQVISYDSLTLLAKTISGPALPSRTWSYSYGSGVSFYMTPGATVRYPVCHPWTSACYEPKCVSDACAGSSTTTVVESGGKWTRHTFGNSYRYNEGKLLKTERGSDASHILRSETRQYDLTLVDQAYPAAVGGGAPGRNLDETFATIYTRPLLRTTISQQGATFDWRVATGCQTGSHCFDEFARPLQVAKSSTISGNPVKTEVVDYHDDLSLWVLGQIERSTTNGIETSRTDYGWKAVPWKIYRFGKLKQTIGYYTSGTPGSISSVTDGNGNKTWLKSWKRGIPQLVQYPATPDQPSGESTSAVVDDNGWITSVIDENGSKTCYAYDAMGRTSRITYPSEAQPGICDTSAWNATTISFKPGYPAARGLPAGHWRQYIETGHGRRVVLFDALWRPVIEQTYDKTSSSTISATLSEVAKRYDAGGRLAFQSYPSRTAINFTDPNLKGTHSTYDALDRPLAVVQDSELGALTTSTEYLSGFKTRVTNPRGGQTLTALYLAYDQPTYEWPRGINHPEGAYTSIYRNIFGSPWAIARFSAGNAVRQTRWYVYDDHQQLCKTIDDESRATVMHYDGAGNLDWSAGGLGLASTTDCQDTDPQISARKVTRSYDARNRLKTLTFPDGEGNQLWSYTPDGLPSSIVTTMLSDTHIVTNQYAYNRRRLLVAENQKLTNWGTYTLGHAYDANGHLASLVYPAGYLGSVVDYAPNALGQPTKAGTFASAVTYHPNGAIKSFTYGNGLKHTLTQNVRGLPDTSCDFSSTCNAGAVLNDGYDYDQNGNVKAISDGRSGNAGDRTMTYDALDRLTKTVAPGMFGTATYAYDVLDNLTRVKLTGGNQNRDHYYCYDGHWRLTNVKTGSCTGTTVMGLGYDVQGNLANRNGVVYRFDYGNRLREVVGREKQYWYDGHGRRVASNRLVNGSSVRRSIYGVDGKLLFVQDQGEAKRKEYIYLGGSLIAERSLPNSGAATPVSVRYQHTDALGSPVAITNESKTVVEQTRYEPYGWAANRLPRSGPGYTGHHEDAATGLVYMQQRYYDPFLQRFVSVDPVTAYGGDMRHFNRYAYAYNNPYKFNDPDGRCPMCVSAGVGAGIGALVGGGIELYKQTGGFKNWGNLNGRALAVEAGRGALVGALAGLGASGAGALATSAGATTTGVAATEVVGGAYATGVGTFATGPASDLAKGTPEKSVGAYGREAVNAGVGALAGGAAGKAVGAVSSVIAKSNAATVAGGVAARAVEETTSATVSSSLSGHSSPPPPPPPRDRENR